MTMVMTGMTITMTRTTIVIMIMIRNQQDLNCMHTVYNVAGFLRGYMKQDCTVTSISYLIFFNQ